MQICKLAGLPFKKTITLNTNRLQFCNALRTDDIDLELIFDKTAFSRRELVTPASFENCLEYGRHRTTVRAVDPGVTDVYVTVDGHEEDRHRIRRLISKEYYHLCGFNHAKEQRRRWEARESAAWHQLIHDLPSMKTADLQQIRGAIEYRLTNFANLVAPYD
ncbi:hypothetical protein INT43_001674 [Umbelopsis isabellina]|uniref:Uncharacterized protein n=1 Tax=Mortierella isabellina TaxID=91625 RepID=A0A8H7PS11_MORIS|nr:hypothetical protein INT43_001674 [Umbelopsis isabellina]